MQISSVILAGVILCAGAVGVSSVVQSQTEAEAGKERKASVYLMEQGFVPDRLMLYARPGEINVITVVNQTDTPRSVRVELGDTQYGLDDPVPPGKSDEFEVAVSDEFTGDSGRFFAPEESGPDKRFEGIVMVFRSEAEGG